MAVVKMTERLIAEVKDIYRSKSDLGRIRPYPADWFDKLYDIIMPKRVYDAFAQLPSEYCMQYAELSISHRGRYFKLSRPGGTAKFYYTPITIPKDVSANNNAYGQIRPIVSNPAWDKFIGELDEYTNDADKNREVLATQVRAIETKLRTYPSLAPALADNPGLWHMLPDWAKEQHRLEKKRKPRTKKERTEISAEANDVFNTALVTVLSNKIGEE